MILHHYHKILHHVLQDSPPFTQELPTPTRGTMFMIILMETFTMIKWGILHCDIALRVEWKANLGS